MVTVPEKQREEGHKAHTHSPTHPNQTTWSAPCRRGSSAIWTL